MISYQENSHTFTLHTQNSTYQMMADRYGFLLHLYYGERVEGQVFDHLLLPVDRGFSGNAAGVEERAYSLDTLPLEYPAFGTGDHRTPALRAEAENGSPGFDLRYEGHELRPGKYALPGLPALYEETPGEAETLAIYLRDAATGLKATLLYGVFEKLDVITRAVVFENGGSAPVTLRRALSACLDVPYGSWHWVHLHGRHLLERVPERLPVGHFRQTVASTRGSSSHQQNPFLLLCEETATEDTGRCYAMNLVYSGSFTGTVEQDQTDLVRLTLGIGDEGFAWPLAPGGRFTAPECVLTFSDKGLTPLSQNLHTAYRHNLVRGKYKTAPRPVLVNNWEATYFEFDTEKLLQLADAAAECGVEMLVMDDGWFGKRNNDDCSLGDWVPNLEKLPGGLAPLADGVNARGLRFGIWVEPEMVSQDSDLYRAHPDWALTTPGRAPVLSRGQLVLDMGRPEVVEYLYTALCTVLDSANIEYVKWDMNRSLSDHFSHALPAGQQGTLAYRYTLGVYDLLERLTARYPNILFEGCSGGGGRFDPGMLHYFPQIWASDNTDAVERLKIQYGTSFAYPPSTWGSHVSAVPNHQTGRTTPLETRGVVAMGGCFGYELDMTRMTSEERAEVRAQIGRFKQVEATCLSGAYYRLNDPFQTPYTAWMAVAQDQSRAVLSIVKAQSAGNAPAMHIRLKGLDENARYRVEGQGSFTGRALMAAGLAFPALDGDYTAMQLLIEKE